MFSGWARGLLTAGAALGVALAGAPAVAQDAVDPIAALLETTPPPAPIPDPPAAPAAPAPVPPPAAEPSAAAPPPASPPPPAPGEAMPTAPDQSTDEEEAAPDTPQAAVATPPTPPAPPAAPATATPPPAPVPTTLRPSLSPPVTATQPAATPGPAPTATPSAPMPYVAPGPRPYTPYPVAPPAPPPPRPQSVRGEPVHIEETNRTPDAPPTPVDLGYEARLRSSFASAQGMQGPLDGRWALGTTGAGGDLYILQLVDTGYGSLEGVWRDVHRPGAIDGSGFLSDIQRVGPGLTFSFYPQSTGGRATAALSQGPDGRWTGELNDGGQKRAIVMRRN